MGGSTVWWSHSAWTSSSTIHLGTFAITTPEFRSIGAAIAGLDIPTTIVQEGGYAVDAIGRNVVSFLDGWS